MRNPARPDGAFEIGNVSERVQVIALAKPFLPQVHQPDALEALRQRVDALEPAGEPRVLPHVRVDEDVSARRGDTRDFREHFRQAPAATGARTRRARSPSRRPHRRTAGASDRRARGLPAPALPRRNTAPRRCRRPRRRSAWFQTTDRPLPHPRSTIRSPGLGFRNRRSIHCRTPACSSGGDTVSWRASACSASSRYFVCSVNDADGRRSRYPARARHDVRTTCRRARRRCRQRPAAVRAADERQQARRDHAAASAACRTGSSRPARASQLYRPASSNALRDRRSASA